MTSVGSAGNSGVEPLRPSSGTPVFAAVESISQDGTYRFKTAAGSLDLRLPEGAKLAVGDTVVLRMTPKGVTVDPVSTSSLSRNVPGDTAVLLSDLSSETIPKLLLTIREFLSKADAGVLTADIESRFSTLEKQLSAAKGQSASLRTELASFVADLQVSHEVNLNNPISLPGSVGKVLSNSVPVDIDGPPSFRIYSSVADSGTPIAKEGSGILPSSFLSKSSLNLMFSGPSGNEVLSEDDLKLGQIKQFAVPLSRAVPEVSAFLDTLKSSAMRGLSPEVFLESVYRSGSISISDIRSLDSALSHSAVMPGSVSAEVLSEALDLVKANPSGVVAARIFVSAGGIGKELAALVGKIPASPLSAVLDDLISKLSAQSAKLSVSAEPSSRSSWLDSLVRLTGITLESDLASGRPKDASIKLALLIELARMDERTAFSLSEQVSVVAATEKTDSLASERSSTPSSLLSTDQLRDKLLGIVERIETSQVGARMRELPDGSVQQSLSLPVQFGGEWTDLHIVVRREKSQGKKKRKDGGISVRIGVSLSGAGDVAADLDYRPGHLLDICLQPGTERTRTWFMENRIQMEQAVSACMSLPVTFSVAAVQKTVIVKKTSEPVASSGLFEAHG